MPFSTEPLVRTRPARAFTLVEAVLSMAIAAILLVGMAAAIRASISGADTGADTNARALAAQSAIEQLRSELATATTLTTTAPASIAFTVPDRDSDGQPETIAYAWSGTPGAPLTRTFNGSAATCIADVRSLTITEVLRSAPVVTESAESTLASCEFLLPTSLVEAPVNSSSRVAVFFRITPPDGVQSWRLTRFRVSLRRETLVVTPATVTASLHAANAAGLPTGSSIASRTASINLGVSNLVPAFIEFAFNTPGLSPSSGFCIVLSSPNPTAVRATIHTSGGTYNTHLLRSTNAGATWSAPNDSDEIRFQALGTLTTLREVD